MPDTSQKTSVTGRSERRSTLLPTLGYSEKLNLSQKNVQSIWNARFGGSQEAGPTGMLAAVI